MYDQSTHLQLNRASRKRRDVFAQSEKKRKKKINQIINYVNCTLRFGARNYFRDALIASIVLLAAGLAIVYRTIWCQIQAAAIILITIAALLCKERERKERVELGIKQQSLVYCMCCQRTNQTALTFGSRVALQQHDSTIYEKLAVPVFGCSLMLLVWVIWIAYSALFHEGAHEAAVNQEIEVIFGFSEQLPPVLHTIRTFLLFMMAMLSLFANTTFAVWHMAAVLLCALLPPSTATAQTLTLGELTARTALFCSLYVVAETYEMNLRHNLWIRNSRNERNSLLVAIQNAFKRDIESARAKTIAQQRVPEQRAIYIDVLSESEVGRSYNLCNSVASLATGLRSCWILLVPREAAPLAIVQIIIMLFLIYSERKKLELDVTEGKLRPVYLEGSVSKDSSLSKCLSSADSESSRSNSSSHNKLKSSPPTSVQRKQQENANSSILTKSKSITVTATTKTTTLAKNGEPSKVSRVVKRLTPKDGAAAKKKSTAPAPLSESQTLAETLTTNQEAPPTFPRVSNGKLPPEIQQIINKNIQKGRVVPKLLQS